MPFTVLNSVKNAASAGSSQQQSLVGVVTVEWRLRVSRKHSLWVAFKMNGHNFRLEIRSMKLAWKFNATSRHQKGMQRA